MPDGGLPRQRQRHARVPGNEHHVHSHALHAAKRLRNIRSRHERAGHMHMCDVSPIDRAAIRSPKQVSDDIGLQHHRHQRLAEGARSIIEFGAAGHTRGEVATRDEHGVNGSIETNDAQLLIRFGLFSGRSCGGSHGALSFLACTRK